MRRTNPLFLLALLLLLLVAPACSLVDRAEQALSGVEITQEQVNEVAAAAVETAETAVNLAAQAPVLVEQGNEAIAAIQNGDVRLPNVDLSAIQSQLQTVRPDENGFVTITLTDEQLNAAVQGGETAVGSGDNAIVLHNSQVRFSNGNAVLQGELTQPLAGTLTITLAPYLVNNSVIFDVVSADFGGLPIPTLILNAAEAMLNNTVTQMLGTVPGNLTLQTIEIGAGNVTINGRYTN